MVTNHFIKRWDERLHNRGIPRELPKQLMVRSFKIVEKNQGQNELVCLIDFNKYGFDFNENELWVIIRDKTLITMFRRNKYVPKTSYCSRVNNVSYVWNCNSLGYMN
jgi:hypothetical protein